MAFGPLWFWHPYLHQLGEALLWWNNVHIVLPDEVEKFLALAFLISKTEVEEKWEVRQLDVSAKAFHCNRAGWV